MPMKKIVLHCAAIFDCENCGRENLVRAITPDFDEEMKQRLRDELGVHPDVPSSMTGYPRYVKCKFCGTEFDGELESNA
jgi:transcription elongation factor Elf1